MKSENSDKCTILHLFIYNLSTIYLHFALFYAKSVDLLQRLCIIIGRISSKERV